MIQNVVSTADLGCNIDLTLIARNLWNIQYNPCKFTAAIIRIRCPATTSLLFSSGKFVCTGGKSIDDNKKAARMVARKIQQFYKTIRSSKKIFFKNYKVQNLVGSFKFRHRLDLIAINMAMPKQTNYDSVIFPGLKLQPNPKEKTTILIFISGKIIITGIKDHAILEELKCYLDRLLIKFIRPRFIS
jgi:transcription initiation factor TFIID TATA-box-binding protein